MSISPVLEAPVKSPVTKPRVYIPGNLLAYAPMPAARPFLEAFVTWADNQIDEDDYDNPIEIQLTVANLKRWDREENDSQLKALVPKAPRISHEDRFAARVQKLTAKPYITEEKAIAALPKNQRTPGAIASFLIDLKKQGVRFYVGHEGGYKAAALLAANGWDISSALTFAQQLHPNADQLQSMKDAHFIAAQEVENLRRDRIAFDNEVRETEAALKFEQAQAVKIAAYNAAQKAKADAAQAAFDDAVSKRVVDVLAEREPRRSFWQNWFD